MKWLVLGSLMFVLAMLAGCDRTIVGIDLTLSPDLRVQVWDSYYDVPVENAFVQVYLPGEQTDASYTAADGWTQWLLVPREAGSVRISISYTDRHWNSLTIYRNVKLERAETTPTFTVNTNAP